MRRAGLSSQELRYRNRREAGTVLAAYLRSYADRTDVVVLALPRGGVPVAYEVAHGLGAPLDVFVVRKLGTPGYEELAMGAIASGGVRVVNHDVVTAVGVPDAVLDAVTRVEEAELARREQAYRGNRPALDVTDRTVILVDDGLATGSTMEAAVRAVQRRNPARVIVAVPVGARETCARLRATADEVICPMTPEPFTAVGVWYLDFSQTSDDEVRALLAHHPPSHSGDAG